MDTSKPTVLVTGGAKRIGAAISQAFADAGWHVVVHYHTSRDAADNLAARLPSAETVGGDLRDEAQMEEMVAELGGRIHDWRALVCSASVFEPDAVARLDCNTFDRAMATNARAPARLAQLYLTCARSPVGRRAIFLTDQKLRNPNPDFFSYTMSKHALAGAIPMLAMGATTPSDRVYGLAPGAILASHDQSEAETEVSHRLNLLARKTAPEEIGEAALFLAEGALASGQTLFVDSGQHLLRQERDVIYLAREGAAA